MNKINAKRKEKYEKNLAKVKSLITKHHTKSIKKLQIYLVEEYGLAISESTLKRYLRAIKKEKNKQIAKKQKTPKVKQVTEHVGEVRENYVRDPSGKEWKLPLGEGILEIQWGIQGLIFWDKESKVWRYSNNHKPFDRNNKPKPFHKTRSNLSFEYDDLND